MEKWSYDEDRRWFWARTWYWSVPAAVASSVACFFLIAGLVPSVTARLWISIGVGLVSALLAVIAAWLSIQLPWMRGGWRIGVLLNGISCAVVAAVCAFFVSAFVMSYLERDPLLNPLGKQEYAAAELTLQYLVASSAFLAFLFGTWFAGRRDRYFVERI